MRTDSDDFIGHVNVEYERVGDVAVLAKGLKSQEISTYIQDDTFGMVGMLAMKMALAKQPGMAEVITIKGIWLRPPGGADAETDA